MRTDHALSGDSLFLRVTRSDGYIRLMMVDLVLDVIRFPSYPLRILVYLYYEKGYSKEDPCHSGIKATESLLEIVWNHLLL